MGVSGAEISFDQRNKKNHDEKVNQMSKQQSPKLRNQFKLKKQISIEKRNCPLALVLCTEVERLGQTNPKGNEKGA